MDARTPRSRARARALRVALCGASALVLLAAVALPVGFSPFSVEPFQKAAHAKGGGPGGGVGPGGDGPPGLSGGNGGGNGNGGGVSSAGHDGEGGHEKDKLGKFNAGNAAEAAFIHASANSTVGQIAIYRQRVLEGLEVEPEGDTITSFQQAIDFLDDFANKMVDEGVVAALNELLGLEPF